MEQASIWEMLIGRVEGPFTFRLVVQPAVAVFFAIRGGLKDARENQTPYLWSVITNRAERMNLIRRGWKDVGRIFFVAIALDVTYELVHFGRIYVGQVLVVAIFLSIVPYIVIRGPMTRLVRRLRAFRRVQSKPEIGKDSPA